jgi:hypothetical protein
MQVNAVGPLLVTQALVKEGLLGPPASVVANVTSKVCDSLAPVALLLQDLAVSIPAIQL